MKEVKFYNPWTKTHEHEIRIERNDIEQALSWYHRMPDSRKTPIDNLVYEGLSKAVAHMRSMDIK